LLHKIIKVLDKKTHLPSVTGGHRVGREVYVGDLSVNNPATFYYNAGVIITSLVKSWSKSIDGGLTVTTENTIYLLERS
jgi:hypothetical protein